MPIYTFQLAAHLAGRAVSVTAAGGTDVVASGTLDSNAKFVATLPVGDYVATAGTGYYRHSSAGTVDLGDRDGLLTTDVANSTFAALVNLARNPDLIITGTITRDANGAATSAPVTWPDGKPGTYTADTLSTAFPGAVDAYHITYGSPVTKTFTQPLITRDASGAATNVPAITVA